MAHTQQTALILNVSLNMFHTYTPQSHLPEDSLMASPIPLPKVNTIVASITKESRCQIFKLPQDEIIQCIVLRLASFTHHESEVPLGGCIQRSSSFVPAVRRPIV